MTKLNKNDFDLDKAVNIFYESLLFDSEDNKQENLIYKKQLESIKYAESYARLGNNDAKRFIISLAQGKEGTVGEFATDQIKRDAFNSIQYFFGNYIKTQCINKFTAANPNATFGEMEDDVNGAVNSVWIEITNDFQSYDPAIAEFSTWARGRIMGGIQNYIAEKKGRKSKTTLQIDKTVFNANKQLKEEGIINPSTVLIAQKAGLSVETVKNSLIRMETENKTLSIENMYTNNENDGYKELNIGETMSPISEDLFSPEKQLMIKERRQTLIDAIHLLSKEEKQVLSLYQGFCFDNDEISSSVDNKTLSISEISELLNLSENKVVNLYSNALNKLKNQIEKENSDVNKKDSNDRDLFLTKRTMLFSNTKEDDDLLLIINSIEDIID